MSLLLGGFAVAMCVFHQISKFVSNICCQFYFKQWREQNWVRIGTDGSIKGACGTSKDKKNPDRCLPLAKAKSLSKAERAATAKKKKRSKGRTQFVSNTKKAKVRG